MDRPQGSRSTWGMNTHPIVERLQALLVDRLIEDAGQLAHRRAAGALRAEAHRLADSGLSEDDDIAVAGWLSGTLKRLEGWA